MAISFPTSPSLNDLHKIGNTTYKWNGSSWLSRWQEHGDPAPTLFNINYPPEVPHAMDDEFNSETLDAKWTSLAGGTPSATWTIRESCLTNTADDTTVSIWQPISGNTWKIQVCVIAPQWFPSNNDGLMVGFHNSANQRTVEFGHWNNSGAAPRATRWTTNLGSLTATPFTGSYSSDNWLNAYVPNYWEFELATTTLTWRWSNMGYTDSWRTMYSETIATHLVNVPTSFGVRIINIPCGLVDWVRRVA